MSRDPMSAIILLRLFVVDPLIQYIIILDIHVIEKIIRKIFYILFISNKFHKIKNTVRSLGSRALQPGPTGRVQNSRIRVGSGLTNYECRVFFRV